MRSLASYLHLSLTIGVVIVLTSVWMLGHFAVSSLTQQFVADKLNHDIESLLASIDLQQRNVGPVREHMPAVYRQPFSGHYYIVHYPGNTAFTSRSLWDFTLTVSDLAPGQSQTRTVAGPQRQELLLISRGFVRKGQKLTIAVAEDMIPFHDRTNVFVRYFAILSVAGLLLLLLLQRLVVRTTVRKLGEIQKDILALSSGEKEQLNQHVPTEVQPLVSEINHLLGMLRDRQKRSRNALGNLAHALKTPLALLMQILERNKVMSVSEVVIATTQASRIQQLIQRELKRARIVGSGSSIAPFDARKELPDLVSALRAMHRNKTIDISLDLDTDLPKFGEREDMLELLGNVLDNAVKWARSRVLCRIHHGDMIEIHVEDDGDELDAPTLDKLAIRGQRLDETVEGHGLGLSIVSDIVKHYGGSMIFRNSHSLHGLQVEIALPIRPAN